MKKLVIVFLAFGFTLSAYGEGQSKTECHKSLSSLSRSTSKKIDKNEVALQDRTAKKTTIVK